MLGIIRLTHEQQSKNRVDQGHTGIFKESHNNTNFPQSKAKSYEKQLGSEIKLYGLNQGLSDSCT